MPRLYHYTSQQAAQDIHCTRTVKLNRARTIYLSDEKYRHGVDAADRLAITGKPVQCYCEIEVPAGVSVYGPSRIYPLIDPITRKVIRLGGGSEYTIHDEVSFSSIPKWKALRSP